MIAGSERSIARDGGQADFPHLLPARIALTRALRPVANVEQIETARGGIRGLPLLMTFVPPGRVDSLVVVALVTCLACRTGPATSQVGSRRFQDLGEGAVLPTAPDSQSVLILLSTSCAACRVASPELRQVGTRLQREGIAVRTVVAGPEREAAEQLVRLYDGAYPTIVDSTGLILRTYGVTTVPSIAAINSSGELVISLEFGLSQTGRNVDSLVGQLVQVLRASSPRLP